MAKNTGSSATPPKAKKIPHTMEKLGDVRQDPYYWMNERDSKPVIDHLHSENDYTKAVLSAAEPIAADLFKEMNARIKESDVSTPYLKGTYYYYSRYEPGKEYPIHCRRKDKLENKEEVILDINILAKGKKYYSASFVDVSPNQNILTFAVDDVGRRFYTLYFKNLKTGKILADKIPDTTGNWVWANDNKTGFYSQQHPETLRSEKILRFTLGKKKSTEVFFEKDDIFNVSVSKSLNAKTIFITTGSFDSTEVLYTSASKPGKFKIFLKREKNHEYGVEDGGDGFYIRTNWKAKNFKIMKSPYSKTAKSAWKDVIPHRSKIYLETFVLFKNFMAMEVRDQGLVHLEIVHRNDSLQKKSNSTGKTKSKVSSKALSKTGLKTESIQFPDAVYVSQIATNENYDTKLLRYAYTSMVQPASILDYDVTTKTSVLMKQQEVPTYKPELYHSERTWAEATDGTKIPISIVYRKDLFQKGENPLFVYAYGSYGISMDPAFGANRVSLLDRGFVYAIAHIRGGQELGRQWYEEGRLMNKKNTFTDFIASTEHLIREGFGKAGRVYAQGGSAGGLLMGAIVNLRPDLYYGVHAAVPFVDVLTTMLDPSIPLTTAEYEQWGNPNYKKAYDYIKSYSPYDNVKAHGYPNILVTTGYHDSQVQYWEPLKWVAKLRDFNTADTKILMRTEMSAGHSGVTGRFARTKESADDYAFVVWLDSLKT